MTGSKYRFLRIEVDASGPIHIHLATDGRGQDPVITLDRADAAALAEALLPVTRTVTGPEPAVTDPRTKDRIGYLEAQVDRMDARVARIEAWREDRE